MSRWGKGWEVGVRKAIWKDDRDSAGVVADRLAGLACSARCMVTKTEVGGK